MVGRAPGRLGKHAGSAGHGGIGIRRSFDRVTAPGGEARPAGSALAGRLTVLRWRARERLFRRVVPHTCRSATLPTTRGRSGPRRTAPAAGPVRPILETGVVETWITHEASLADHPARDHRRGPRLRAAGKAGRARLTDCLRHPGDPVGAGGPRLCDPPRRGDRRLGRAFLRPDLSPP